MRLELEDRFLLFSGGNRDAEGLSPAGLEVAAVRVQRIVGIDQVPMIFHQPRHTVFVAVQFFIRRER